jgi:hypothetical protein
MRKTMFCILLLGASILGVPETKAQCDCIGATPEIRGRRYRTAYEELKNSDVVFIGEVIEIKKVEKPPDSVAYKGADHYELEILFKVKRTWKKALGESVAVRNAVEGCLIGFKKGEQYLVYAAANGKMLRTWYCSRTRLLAKAAKDLREFEERRETPVKIIRTSSAKP